jgi:putative transposase
LKKNRNNYSAEFKAKVAKEALKGELTIAEIASKYEVHSNQVMQWKKLLDENMAEIFIDKRKKETKEKSGVEEYLYGKIGKLEIENDFLKKKLGV